MMLGLREACAPGVTVSFTRMPGSALRSTPQQLLAAVQGFDASASRIGELDHHTLACQIHLARIPAPTGAENERAAVVARLLGQLGYTTRLDAAGNVIASDTITQRENERKDSSASPVVCMAHLDTVFEAGTSLELSRDGTLVSCPGIGDNSRGLATMLTLARVFREKPFRNSLPRRRIEFVASVGEEGLGNLRGARAYFSQRSELGLAKPHGVLVLDGPGDQTIVHHALGSRRYRVTFRGAGGHSWADFGLPNAVHAASRAAAWLADLPRSLSGGIALNGRVALTVSSIGGGESMNAIPANAWFDVDVRATDTSLLTRVDLELREIVNAATSTEISASLGAAHVSSRADSISAFHYDITLLGERPCGVLPREHTLVQLAEAATRRAGVEPVSAIASTDANIPLSLGIPAITIGGGGTGGGAHTIHEWYDNTNGPRGVARAFAILAALSA